MSVTRSNKMPVAIVFVASTVLLQSCASPDVDRSRHFRLEPLTTEADRDASAERQREQDTAPGVEQKEVMPGELRVDRGPAAPRSDVTLGDYTGDQPELELEGEPIRLDVNNLPLPVFINEVFGEKLGLSYSLAPSLQNQKDLITLRLSEPLEPSALFRAARTVLADYGVAIARRDGVWTFTASDEVSTDGAPLLITGEALPDVPVSHRPVFQVIELNVVRNAQIRSLLTGLFQNRKVEITEDAMRNAIMLKGPAADVADAVDAVRFFDRPVLKGRNSLLLRPAYREIPALHEALEKLLSAQGYALGSPAGSSGSVILIPMPELEVIVALANDAATLSHIQDWAQKLDRDYQREIDSGMFIYEVQNTSAANLANLIGQLYGGGSVTSEGGGSSSEPRSQASDGGGFGDSSSSAGSATGGAGSAPQAASAAVAGGQLVVDQRRNVLVFRGSGRNWMELRKIIEQLDQQVPSVLLEVLLAEITLNDGQNLGVEFRALADIGDLSGTLGTLGGLGISGSGFSYTLNSAGQTRAIINAFFDSNQAVIRSSPKIMVKSGEVARIEVGNEIPVLTSTAQTGFDVSGDTQVLQQFQFRQTGVNLVVEPIVQASGLVDIRISQTLSETQDTGTGAQFLPTILNRSVETSLTLRDGGSVVLGGFISRTTSKGTQGVPVFGKLPIVGQLFRTDSENSSTTELLIMVVPYVIRDDADAQRISEQMRSRIRDAELEL